MRWRWGSYTCKPRTGWTRPRRPGAQAESAVGELRADLHRQADEAASALAAAEERHARALERYATDAATTKDQLEARLRAEAEAALARHEGALATEAARTMAAAEMAEALRAEMSRQEAAYGALLDQVRATAEAQAARAEEAAAARVAPSAGLTISEWLWTGIAPDPAPSRPQSRLRRLASGAPRRRANMGPYLTDRWRGGPPERSSMWRSQPATPFP